MTWLGAVKRKHACLNKQAALRSDVAKPILRLQQSNGSPGIAPHGEDTASAMPALLYVCLRTACDPSTESWCSCEVLQLCRRRQVLHTPGVPPANSSPLGTVQVRLQDARRSTFLACILIGLVQAKLVRIADKLHNVWETGAFQSHFFS